MKQVSMLLGIRLVGESTESTESGESEWFWESVEGTGGRISRINRIRRIRVFLGICSADRACNLELCLRHAPTVLQFKGLGREGDEILEKGLEGLIRLIRPWGGILRSCGRSWGRANLEFN